MLLSPSSVSSSGYPYLHRPAFQRLRDWVPHILGDGPRVLDVLARIEAASDVLDDERRDNLSRAAQVVRQVVHTASVTAPPNLWLLRHVFSTFAGAGLLRRLLDGEVLVPGSCDPFDAAEIRIDLNFLMGRGYVIRQGRGVRMAECATAIDVARRSEAIDSDIPAALTDPWRRAFGDEELLEDEAALLMRVAAAPPLTSEREAGRWTATLEDIELGYRMVPMVLGLWASGRLPALLSEDRPNEGSWIQGHPALDQAATDVLAAAGVLDESRGWTAVGRRLVGRGIGAFGIIEAYHPYMACLEDVLVHGRGSVHVGRGANITASQEANRRTFEKANDALDRFCSSTGFEYTVFIEHAIGRGEATRQRFERSGDAALSYVGADLEDAAIDAAEQERDSGHLPQAMRFIRRADIGNADYLVEAIRATGLETEGAVMIVGNGFHEIRNQSDEGMVAVFRAYEAAGILLLFTEESALSVDDLLETAWNTYHAGFRYVHERSGQGLRPAGPPAPTTLGRPLPASWNECATKAGYVRASAYCSRSRTIYPYTPPHGHNPSISVNHFFVPERIAHALALQQGETTSA